MSHDKFVHAWNLECLPSRNLITSMQHINKQLKKQQ